MSWTNTKYSLPPTDDDSNSDFVLMEVYHMTTASMVVHEGFLSNYKWYWIENGKEVSKEFIVTGWMEKPLPRDFKDTQL